MSGFFETIKKPNKKSEGEPLWLLAYVDLTTNLMALFVLMLAISKVDNNKFDSIKTVITRTRTDTLDLLEKRLITEIQKKNLSKMVKTQLGEFGLQVEFQGNMMFESSSDKLTQKALVQVTDLLKVLARTDKKYKLSLEGHTDDVPPKNTKQNNWTLSSQRGLAFLLELKKWGVPEHRMNVAGFAHTKPKVPLDGKSGVALAEARSQNRRVIVRVYQ